MIHGKGQPPSDLGRFFRIDIKTPEDVKRARASLLEELATGKMPAQPGNVALQVIHHIEGSIAAETRTWNDAIEAAARAAEDFDGHIDDAAAQIRNLKR